MDEREVRIAMRDAYAAAAETLYTTAIQLAENGQRSAALEMEGAADHNARLAQFEGRVAMALLRTPA